MVRPIVFTTPHGKTFNVILEDPPLEGPRLEGFESWPISLQNEYIELLRGHLSDLRADGSLRHLCVLAGNPDAVLPPNIPPELAAFRRDDRIDGVSWKLAMALKKTKPTRISEAVDLLKFVVAMQKRLNGGALKEALPGFCLGVACSNNPGMEDEAIQAFTEGFNAKNIASRSHGNDRITLNELWALSHFARVLRQRNRVQEAKRQELKARQWILKNLTICAPSTFKKYAEGPWGTGEHITDHGDVLEQFSQIEEIGPGQAIWHHGDLDGRAVKLVDYGRKS